MRLNTVRVTSYLKDTPTVTDLHSEIKACRYCSVAPPAEWKSLSDCPSYVPHRPSVWLQSELGALSVRLIPQSDTSARTNAPDEKVNCGGTKIQKHHVVKVSRLSSTSSQRDKQTGLAKHKSRFPPGIISNS